MRMLVQAGADVNYEFIDEKGRLQTPLAIVIESRSKVCISFLVQKGAIFYYYEPEKKDLSPIFQAIRTQDLSTVQALYVNIRGDLAGLGSLMNSEGLSVIHQACKYSSREIIEYLATHSMYFGIDLNAPDPSGFTILMKVIFLKRDFDLAEELVAQGADVD